MSCSYRFECKLPLPKLDEYSNKDEIKHGVVNTDIVGGSICSRDLMVFSTMKSSDTVYQSIKELICDIMFVNKENGIQYLDKIIDELKINKLINKNFSCILNENTYTDCSVAAVLEVNILIFKEFSSPKQLLEPFIFLNLLDKEKVNSWPVICIKLNEDGLFQLVFKATLATRDKFTNFLFLNVTPIYKEYVAKKLTIDGDYNRYLPAPYNTSDWDMAKSIDDCLLHYNGIFVNSHKPVRKNQKILGLGTNKGCIIMTAEPNKKIEKSESIVELLKNYLFGENKNDEFLTLFHEIKQRMMFYRQIFQISEKSLLLFLAVLSQSLRINLCILRNQHFISLRNIISKNNFAENCSDPIVAIMEVDGGYCIISKVAMGDNRNLYFPVAHSIIEETFFRYIKRANGNVLDINLDDLCNDIYACDSTLLEKKLLNKNRFLKKLEAYCADLAFRIKFPIHEKERYEAFCERTKESNITESKNVESSSTNKSALIGSDDSHQMESICTYNTTEDNEIIESKQSLGVKRPFAEISNETDDEVVDIETIEQCSNVGVECLSLEPPGKIEKGDKNTIKWIPNETAFSLIRSVKPTDNEKIVTRTAKMNWSNLIKNCLQKDPVTPRKYDIFKRNVYKIWDDILNEEMISQDEGYGKIELEVDGFDHLIDNGIEIVGMLSERKYTDQIIVKINPADYKINCLVNIYNLSMKTSLENEITEEESKKPTLKKCELFKHYYRCTNCKKIGDEFNKNVKLGKYGDDIPDKPKAATLIKTFKGNLCVDTRMGKNKEHCKGCEPISLLVVLADQFEKKVKILSSKRYVTFEAAYQRMLAGTMELAEIHGIQYERILEHCLPKEKLREQCAKCDEFFKIKQKSISVAPNNSFCSRKKGTKSLFR
uniref:Regulator of chromosome condensation n=1 Tax=Strongyloides venezuelensis TaxID=75913 RepID=A0A0K0EVE6_STRVS